MLTSLCSLWLFVSLFSLCSAYGGARIVNGRLRLFGTSFGIPGVNSTFDYVVVGGGTAGLTVANRLASNGTFSVAVVEAGGFYEIENSNRTQIPAYGTYNTSTALDDIQPLTGWGDITPPQESLNGRRMHYAQGRMLGGGSAKNYGGYHRPSQGSFEQWAEQTGDESYRWPEVFPFFQRSVEFTPPNYEKRNSDEEVLYDDLAFSSSGGPLQVGYGNYVPPSTPYIQFGYADRNLTRLPGMNSGNIIGFSEFTRTIDPLTQTRSSSETSFLQDSIENSDLLIYTQTQAERVLFDDTGRAEGVQVISGNQAYILYATREVILSAGAFRSPQLLMLSGIGPAETLASFDIPVVSELEGVGRNLWDQPYFGLTYRVNVTTQSRLTWDREYSLQATEDYLANQTGPLTLGGGNVAFEKLPSHLRSGLSNSSEAELAWFNRDWPELEFVASNYGVGSTNQSNDTSNYLRMNVGIMAPTSRGNITLNSTNPGDSPVVNVNYFSTEADQQLAVQGLRRAREFIESSGIAVGPEVQPGPDAQTDEQLLQYAMETVGPFYHASATCAMGREDDPNAVVDTAGRVYGVQGLRVIDASAFPFLPPGHPQSVVYMLAEKLAEGIMEGN